MLRSLLSCCFSAATLKTEDLFWMGLLPWAQEVPSSNLGAPSTYSFIFSELSRILQRQKRTWVQVQSGSRWRKSLVGLALSQRGSPRVSSSIRNTPPLIPELAFLGSAQRRGRASIHPRVDPRLFVGSASKTKNQKQKGQLGEELPFAVPRGGAGRQLPGRNYGR